MCLAQKAVSYIALLGHLTQADPPPIQSDRTDPKFGPKDFAFGGSLDVFGCPRQRTLLRASVSRPGSAPAPVGSAGWRKRSRIPAEHLSSSFRGNAATRLETKRSVVPRECILEGTHEISTRMQSSPDCFNFFETCENNLSETQL